MIFAYVFDYKTGRKNTIFRFISYVKSPVSEVQKKCIFAD